jgi:hypothetical protein
LALAERNINAGTAAADRPALPDVLEEHLEEVGYLSIQRRKLLFSPEVPLRRLRQHAERIEAHLDGLRIGGPSSVKPALAKLDGDDPWFVYAAARAWLELAKPDAAAVTSRLQDVPPQLRPAWKEAFRQLPGSVAGQAFPQKNPENLPPPILEIALDAWGWHGLLPAGVAAKFIGSDLPEVRRAVARHAEQADGIARLLEDDDLLVRHMALWRLALLNPREALGRTRQSLRTEQPDPFAIRIAGLFGEHGDGRLLVPLLARKEVAAAALEALRDLAYPEFAEALFEVLDKDDEEAAAGAKETFESLAGRVPAQDPASPLPEGVSPVRYFWKQRRPQLDLSARRLGGLPFPWQGPPADEPMAWVWRRSLAGAVPEAPWLRNEVPDGFFSGFPSSEAKPGE